MRSDIVLLIQVVTTFSMLGVFWFVQIIHYPLYKKIKEGFVQYERSNIRRTACLLGPLLIIDFITSIMLILAFTDSMLIRLATASLVMIALTWLFTFMFQVQQHQKLSVQFSKTSIEKLISTNRIRTCFWTIKSALIIWMLLEILSK